MVEIFESDPNLPTYDEYQEIINSIKPKLINALKENSYISDLHRQLDEKSKYLKFNDLISYHPETSVEYALKEKVACLVSKWYNEHLETCQIEIDERHKCDYPLAVLLPVVLESISNSKLIYIDSEDEGTKDIQLNSNSDIAQECYSHGVASELEKLCPIWQGEFNDILHVNTCSIDNVISLIGLNKVSIENAIKFTGFTPNTDGEHFLSLIHDLKFDELRHDLKWVILMSQSILLTMNEPYATDW